ncbi:MAG: phosphatidylglycerophosphatase A [Planctomycetota bacterium]|nr:phosphatidylglycerophosphatase A [Planctomycetota bacterium]MDA1105125.1 phosphatidylglycerophosphatase A [Planctomycetota bacterium]
MGLRPPSVLPGGWGETPWFARHSLTCFGLGYLPASGSWGSLPPCVVLALLWSLQCPAWVNEACLLLLAAWGSIACLRFGDAGERATGTKDPGIVVADEVAGMALTLLFLPRDALTVSGHVLPEWSTIALAFVVFRAFDVLKLPPARGIQSMRGGAGILMDDIVAAAQGWILLQLGLRWVVPSLLA